MVDGFASRMHFLQQYIDTDESKCLNNDKDCD